MNGGTEQRIPLFRLVVDQRSVYEPVAAAAPVGTRCWFCGQVPRYGAAHLEPDGDAWRCRARKACAVRGPDPLRTGGPA